jgi:threonine dehydratase
MVGGLTLQPGLDEIQAAAAIVYSDMLPTPQYCWPLLCERLGAEVWVKHENHTPVGAFKIRGGLVYFAHYAQSEVLKNGVISATRGNHGQSLGFAARRHGVPATVVVPYGNSVEKNDAMRALGVELIEYGDDFQSAREQAARIAQERGLHIMPSFHSLLVAGVATYSHELLRVVRDIDVAYVPIGLGSGICGMVAVRDALGLKTKIAGVVSAHARAYAESFASRSAVESEVSTKLADGMACRVPESAALEVIWRGVDRIVTVTDEEIATAMRMLFECTHNICEGAGAAATAAAIQERPRIAGRRVAVVVSGGNVDRNIFASVLKGEQLGNYL